MEPEEIKALSEAMLTQVAQNLEVAPTAKQEELTTAYFQGIIVGLALRLREG